MADLARMESALRNAHAAGDTQAAKQIANAIKAARAQNMPDESQLPDNAPEQTPIDPYKDRAAKEADKLESLGLKRLPGSGFMDGIVDGLTFGFSDEMSSAINAPFRAVRDKTGLGEAYNRETSLQREQKTRQQEATPIQSTAGEIAGGILGGGTLMRGGLTMAGKSLPFVGRTGAAAAEGAAYGGAYGAGNADGEDMLRSAATGATIGAVTGGALERVGSAVANRAARKAMPVAPTADDLGAQGAALYKQASQAGVTIKPKAMNKLAGNIGMKMRSMALDAELQPETTRVLRRVLAVKDQPLTLDQLDNLRKIASGVSREAAKKSDKRAAGLIVEQIDAVIDDASNFSAGSSQALKSLQSAREVWKRKLRVEALEELNEKAMNQATGYENGLVIQLRSLANNKKRMALFSKEEQKAIKDAVRRGGVRSTLKALGMLSPTSTFGGLMTGGVGVGSGVIPAATVAGIGLASRKGAEALTRNRFNNLQQGVARGGFIDPALLPNKARPLIGGATAGTTGLLQQ